MASSGYSASVKVARAISNCLSTICCAVARRCTLCLASSRRLRYMSDVRGLFYKGGHSRPLASLATVSTGQGAQKIFTIDNKDLRVNERVL